MTRAPGESQSYPLRVGTPGTTAVIWFLWIAGVAGLVLAVFAGAALGLAVGLTAALITVPVFAFGLVIRALLDPQAAIAIDSDRIEECRRLGGSQVRWVDVVRVFAVDRYQGYRAEGDTRLVVIESDKPIPPGLATPGGRVVIWPRAFVDSAAFGRVVEAVIEAVPVDRIDPEVLSLAGRVPPAPSVGDAAQ